MPALATLTDWLAYLETLHPLSIDMGLARVGKVKDALALRFQCPVITVGGTNGKGSTCTLIESMLLRAGYRVGCHTSPPLLAFNECARINGEVASDNVLLAHFEAVERARNCFSEPVPLTYFEFTTLAIMHCFATRELDVIILEVGLGGRLDAVNIIDTDCAVITSIDLDHLDYLGDTREKIGLEKAGIFRPGKPAICGDPVPPRSLIDYANRIGADLWLVGRDFRYVVQAGCERRQWRYQGRRLSRAALAWPALRGANQLLNASAALAALEALRDQLPLSAHELRLGLAQAELPARFQVLPGRPAVVLDVAHNPHAAAALKQNLDSMGFFPATYAVFGAMQDKDIAGMIRQTKDQVDYWCLTDLPAARAAPAALIERLLSAMHVPNDERRAADGARDRVKCFATPAQAYENALRRATENDRIVVFGSFHTVAGVMAYRKNQSSDQISKTHRI